MAIWTENGLVEKLLAAKVVVKRRKGIVFSDPFSHFMLKSVEDIQQPLKILAGCRNTISRYNAALRHLSDSEVRAVMVLLGFYIQNVDGPTSAES